MDNKCFLKYNIVKCYDDGSIVVLPIKKRECFDNWKLAKEREKELNEMNKINFILNNVTDLYCNIELTYNQ